MSKTDNFCHFGQRRKVLSFFQSRTLPDAACTTGMLSAMHFAFHNRCRRRKSPRINVL